MGMGDPHGIVANMLDCDIKLSINSTEAIVFIFGQMPFRKAWASSAVG